MSTYRTPPQCRWAGSARRGGIDQFPQCTARARALEAWSTLRLSFSLGTHFVKKSAGMRSSVILTTRHSPSAMRRCSVW